MHRALATTTIIEVYANEGAAIAGLQMSSDAAPGDRSPLPEWAKAPEVVEIGCVTRLRPDELALEIKDSGLRPGHRYLELIRQYGRERLVIDWTHIRFGNAWHPFHDDIFAIAGAIRQVGGRLAICGFSRNYVEHLERYSFMCVRCIPSKVDALSR
jgi:hypothetical protein